MVKRKAPKVPKARFMASTVTNGFGAQPELPEDSVHLSTGKKTPTAPSTSAAKRRPLPTTTDTVTRNARRQEEK